MQSRKNGLYYQSEYSASFRKKLYLYRSEIKWKELVFKIELTENEYKLLMQEKSKSVLRI